MPAQLIVKCHEHLQTVRDFADRTSQREDLEKHLDYLTSFGDETSRVELFSDFAPYSFYWEEWNKDKRVMNGGLIYHGQHDQGGNGSAPTYSVNLLPVNGWQIHT